MNVHAKSTSRLFLAHVAPLPSFQLCSGSESNNSLEILISFFFNQKSWNWFIWKAVKELSHIFNGGWITNIVVNNKKNISLVIIILLREDKVFHLTLCGWLGIFLQTINISRDLLQGFISINLLTPKKKLPVKCLV